MKKTIFIFLVSFISFKNIFSQTIDPWKIKADKIDPSNYYGVTVANGMIGIVSSPEPFKVKDVVLAGAYDLYGRGRVSNFLRSFNLLNMYLEVDKKRLDSRSVSNFQQELDMKHANFTSRFDYGDKASVTYTYYSLRHLPYTVLMDISITAKKDIKILSQLSSVKAICHLYQFLLPGLFSPGHRTAEKEDSGNSYIQNC